jgi:hypothetical protein
MNRKPEIATDEQIENIIQHCPRLRSFQRAYLRGNDSTDTLRGKANKYSLRYERAADSVDRLMRALGWEPDRDSGPRGGYRHRVSQWVEAI